MTTRLRDKNGRVFLDCEQLSKSKGYTRFDLEDEADIPVVGDETEGDDGSEPDAKAAPKAAPKPAPKTAPKGTASDALKDWE